MAVFLFQAMDSKAANRRPRIDDIPNYGPILENSGLHQITLTGISPGRNEDDQVLTISASSDNESLIKKVNIQYEQGSTAILSFSLIVNANGKAKITVTLDDGERSRGTKSETFTVTVSPVNGKPSFELSSKLISIEENPGRVEIANFAVNIDDGDPDEKQQLRFVTSIQNITGDLSFISLPQINANNGDLAFECKPEVYGEASILVILKDGSGTQYGGLDVSDEATFVIRIGQTNSPPTLDNIPGPITVLEDSGEQIIQLTGISSGDDEEFQKLTFTAFSDNMELISEVKIEYVQGAKNAQLRFISAPNLFGIANITITIDDGQPINNKILRKAFVIVNPVADTPEVSAALLMGSKQTSSGLVIGRNAADGDEVTHYKITGIQQGKLFLHDGVTEILSNTFITHAEGNQGLKFTVSNPNATGTIFNVQAATGPDENRLGGKRVPAKIIVDNDPPRIVSIPDSIIEVSYSYVYNVKAVDPDESDVLNFTIEIPKQIQSWLKTIESEDGTTTIFGTPPLDGSGVYLLKIRVEDRIGAFDEQVFNLTVNEQNQKPELMPFSIDIEEDEVIYFEKESFTNSFFDEDGDTLFYIKAANLPEFGSLYLNETLIEANVEVAVNDIQNLSYIPSKDYFGLDVFDWTASDGKDYSVVPKRVRILISSVNDPPELINFEENAFVFEFGDESVALTKTAMVFDADEEKLVKAEIAFTEGYTLGEDSLYYDLIEGLNYNWKDSVGVLSINGVSPTSSYQEAIRSLKYINLDRLSPNGEGRTIEILLSDSDTSSIPYLREIYFEDNFEELEIPNAFTPNGDFANDSWEITDIERYGGYDLTVYSKSGQQVFKSSKRRKKWDGTYNGKLVPVGNYYYVIRINKFQKTYTGTVLVLR